MEPQAPEKHPEKQPEKRGGNETEAPERIRCYEVLEHLDTGEAGRRFRARDERVDREVTLILPADGMAGDLLFARARRLAHTVHPALANILDLGREEGRTFIVQETLPEENLARRLEGGPLPAPTTREMAAHLGEAILAAGLEDLGQEELVAQHVFLEDGRYPRCFSLRVEESQRPREASCASALGKLIRSCRKGAEDGDTVLDAIPPATEGAEFSLERLVRWLRDGSDPGELKPVRRDSAPVSNVPTPLTEFVGRRSELLELREALAPGVLVTLRGPGGAGKTRLAIEVAAGRPEVATIFADLSEQWGEDGLWSVLGAALGVAASAPSVLRALDRHASSLVILDNCEQLIEHAARCAAQLLEALPGLAVLATSREPLGLPHEQVVEIGGLPVPTAGAPPGALERNEAVRLFLDRAGDALAPVADPESLAAVSEIARRLDGLPLALELAAARADLLAPKELADRLQHGLALLRSTDDARSARQRTMEAVVAWSFDLLRPEARNALLDLSVFRGGFSLRRAEAVLGRSLATVVDELVAKSLLRAEKHAGEPRYSMLKTIEAFATARWRALRDDEERQRLELRHADAILELMDRLREQGQSQGHDPAADRRVEVEADNLRAAEERMVAAGEIERAERLLAAEIDGLAWRGLATGSSERLERQLAALGSAPGNEILRARVETRLARVLLPGATAARARDHASSAAELARRANAPGELAAALGILAQCEPRLQPRLELVEEQVRVAEDAEDRQGLTRALAQRGFARAAAGDLAEAERDLERALALTGTRGHPVVPAQLLRQLAVMRLRQGQSAAALEAIDQAATLFRRCDAGPMLAEAESIRCSALLSLGRAAEALAPAHEARDLYLELGLTAPLSTAQSNLGLIHVHRGELDAAVAECSRGVSWARRDGNRFKLGRSLSFLAGAHLALGEDHAALRHAEPAVEIARKEEVTDGLGQALLHRGIACSRLDRGEQALEDLTEAQEIARDPGTVASVQFHLALHHLRRGDLHAATQGLAAAIAEAPAGVVKLLLLGLSCTLSERRDEPVDPSLLSGARPCDAESTPHVRERLLALCGLAAAARRIGHDEDAEHWRVRAIDWQVRLGIQGDDADPLLREQLARVTAR